MATKTILVVAALAVSPLPAFAQFGSTFGTGSNPRSNSVDGYRRSDGTNVEPYQRTNPNSTRSDNYGTSGNYNPNNGEVTRSRPRY